MYGGVSGFFDKFSLLEINLVENQLHNFSNESYIVKSFLVQLKNNFEINFINLKLIFDLFLFNKNLLKNISKSKSILNFSLNIYSNLKNKFFKTLKNLFFGYSNFYIKHLLENFSNL